MTSMHQANMANTGTITPSMPPVRQKGQPTEPAWNVMRENQLLKTTGDNIHKSPKPRAPTYVRANDTAAMKSYPGQLNQPRLRHTRMRKQHGYVGRTPTAQHRGNEDADQNLSVDVKPKNDQHNSILASGQRARSP